MLGTSVASFQKSISITICLFQILIPQTIHSQVLSHFIKVFDSSYMDVTYIWIFPDGLYKNFRAC